MLKALVAVARVIALAHTRWAAKVAPRRPMIVEISILRLTRERLMEENEMLRSRLRRLPARRRPHYLRHERLEILWHAAKYGLSVKATARTFVVSIMSVVNWRRDLTEEKPRLLATKAPANKIPDLVAEIARRLKREWPRWGTRRIAGMLARLGLQVSRTSVQAFLRRPLRPAEVATLPRPTKGLVARRPGHVWFIDFTQVGNIFRSVVVGAVIDGFSRKVLALRATPHEPAAAFAIRLVREAIREFGVPRWIVTDQGTQFTAKEFIRELRQRGIGHRYGAVHRHGSLAVIERFMKSFKVEFAHGLFLFRRLGTIERQMLSYVRWFNEARPHQGLGQLTPDEVHFGKSTRAKAVPLQAVLRVEPLDGDRELPVLSLRHAA